MTDSRWCDRDPYVDPPLCPIDGSWRYAVPCRPCLDGDGREACTIDEYVCPGLAEHSGIGLTLHELIDPIPLTEHLARVQAYNTAGGLGGVGQRDSYLPRPRHDL